MYPYNGSIPDVLIHDEDVEHNIDEYDNDDDDERSAADYGMIGVLDCSVINCPLFPPESVWGLRPTQSCKNLLCHFDANTRETWPI